MVDPSALNGTFRIFNYHNKNLFLNPKGPLVLQTVSNASDPLDVQSVTKLINKKNETTTTISGGGLSLAVQSNKFAVAGDKVVFGTLADSSLILANCLLNLYLDNKVPVKNGFQIYIRNASRPGLLFAPKYQNLSDASNNEIIPDLIVQNPVTKSARSEEYARTVWQFEGTAV